MKNRWKNWLVALTTIVFVFSAGSLCVAMEVQTRQGKNSALLKLQIARTVFRAERRQPSGFSPLRAALRNRLLPALF